MKPGGRTSATLGVGAMVSNTSEKLPENLIAKLDELLAQYEQLTQDLAAPETVADHRRAREISIKRAAIEPLAKE